MHSLEGSFQFIIIPAENVELGRMSKEKILAMEFSLRKKPNKQVMKEILLTQKEGKQGTAC